MLLRTLSLALALGLLASACKRTEAASNTSPTPASSTSPLIRTQAERLALAPIEGNAPVDTLLTLYQKNARILPGKGETWVLLGRTWIRKARETGDPGYYTHANACADMALALNPDDGFALVLRAQVLLNDHKFTEAKDLSEQILSRNPEDRIAWSNLSDALLELGRFDEATRAAQKMMDLKPNLPAYIRASYLRWLKGDVQGAKEAAWQAVDAGRDVRDPEPGAWALVQAAMLFWHQGDYDGADAGFDRALQVFSDYPPALVGKGRVALAKGDSKRAIHLFEKAYALSPLIQTAWFLGDARELSGDRAGAKETFTQMIQRGKQVDPRTTALFLAVKNQTADEAVRLAEREKQVRGDIFTDDTLAWALYRAGRFTEAATASERAVRLGTKDAQLLYHQGAIMIAVGRVSDGVKRIKEALALNPKFDVTGAAEAASIVDGEARTHL